MPKTRPKSGYTLRDSPFFRLRSRKRLAELLQVMPATLAAIGSNEDLYVRKWKHKTLKDNEPQSWLKREPDRDQAASYRSIDIPDPRLKAIQSRIAELLARITPPDFLYSPVKGRSYVDNAAQTRSGCLMSPTISQAAPPITLPGSFTETYNALQT